MKDETMLDLLKRQGVTRRGFLQFCAASASMLALPPSMASVIAEAMATTRRPTVIWLSFQECTGCTESLTRAHTSSIETLIFDAISLDYHETLQVAAGSAAEEARAQAMKDAWGSYLLLVDGSISTKDGGVYSAGAGKTNLETLKEVAAGAAAIVSIGTCAAYGGLPYANPNPTGAVPVSDIIKDKPIINVPGCPPIPVVMTGVLTHYLTFGKIPELDSLGRPKAYFGDAIHDRCYRRPFYDKGMFAKTFDDEGARNGWCLFELGCKGPVTHSVCATTKWNQGTSFPIQSGHGCLGCTEPNFWDAGSFYQPLSTPLGNVGTAAGIAVAAGAATGIAVGLANRSKKAKARKQHQPTTIDDLEM
jgi:hydrogenase small subunit